MRPLYEVPTLAPEAILALRHDVVPAPLHDTAEEVYDDKLYSLYTVSSTANLSEINVTIIAANLVQHTAGNGEKGYWVGIGINNEICEQADAIYKGWGVANDLDLGEPTEPDSEFTKDDQTYKTWYWDSGKSNAYANLGYIVVVLGTVHLHYVIDFSHITRMEANEGADAILWNHVSIQSIKQKYLFGINLCDPQGNPLPDELLAHYINAAIQWWQNTLDIIIEETPFENEQHDYIRNDYMNWGFLETLHKPVKEIKRLQLMYGTQPSLEIPLDWIQLNKLTGQVTLFPQAGSASSLIIGNTGLLYGFQSQWQYAPSLWRIDYVAGIDEEDKTFPLDLLEEGISKRAAMGILNVWGEIYHQLLLLTA